MHPLRRLLLIAPLLLGSLAAPSAVGAPQDVLVVLSRQHESYLEVVEGMRAEAASDGGAAARIRVSTPGDFAAQIAQGAPDVIVTVGTAAAKQVIDAAPSVPVLHTLIPEQTWGELRAPRAHSAIFLDQPMGRHFDLIRAALPKARRVGVLLGPVSQSREAALAEAARHAGLQLQAARAANPARLLANLARLLENSDVLLIVPDPEIYNASSIHHILLTTYRHGVPVVGLSRAYVEAGALLAVYSTPRQIGREALQWTRGPNRGPARPGAARAPRDFDISVNHQVGASIDINVPDAQTLTRRLRQGAP